MTSTEQQRVEEIVPLELLPRTARNRFGQVAKLWTTAGLERLLAIRIHLQGQAS